MFSQQVLLSAFLLACLIASSLAIECYECDSIKNQNCEVGKFNSEGMSKCSGGKCYAIQYSVSDLSATLRGCSAHLAEGISGAVDMCATIESLVTALRPELQPLFTVGICMECSTDLCN